MPQQNAVIDPTDISTHTQTFHHPDGSIGAHSIDTTAVEIRKVFHAFYSGQTSSLDNVTPILKGDEIRQALSALGTPIEAMESTNRIKSEELDLTSFAGLAEYAARLQLIAEVVKGAFLHIALERFLPQSDSKIFDLSQSYQRDVTGPR
jgi:hypothetical protein